MSKSVRDYEKLAVDIIDAVGGKNNIIKDSSELMNYLF